MNSFRRKVELEMVKIFRMALNVIGGQNSVLLKRSILSMGVAWVVAILVGTLTVLEVTEQRARDGLTKLVLQRDSVDGIAIIDISEETLKAVGSWPWSRAQLADLVEMLLGPLGARGVALDIVLPAAGDPGGDARLASLARNAPLTLGLVLDFESRLKMTSSGALPGGLSHAEIPADLPFASGFVGNHEGLENARCVGHIGVRLDDDGVLRHLPLQARLSNQVFDSLALALLRCADPESPKLAAWDATPFGIGKWRIPFRKDLNAFLTVPAEEIFKGTVDPALIRDRYIFVGASAVGLSDHVATPLHPLTAGVLVHAQALSELLDRSLLSPPEAKTRLWHRISAVACIVAAWLIVLAFSRSIKKGLVLAPFLAGAWLVFCAYGFSAGRELAVLPPLAALFVAASVWLGGEFTASRAASRRALQTLSHYVAAPVLHALMRQGLIGSLAPSRREITVLVADMASYTQLTAQSSLEVSARLTTEFLESITIPVLKSQATLDRYTGDGLIAFWGAPLTQTDHADRAMEAALDMLRALSQLNVSRKQRGEQLIRMRIGIESGEALVGDLGSSARSVYTAVGTCINLASRLQEAARDTHVSVLVGPGAQSRATRNPLVSLGALPIRGLPDPVPLFTLTSDLCDSSFQISQHTDA
jgi:adenylate cyclase